MKVISIKKIRTEQTVPDHGALVRAGGQLLQFVNGSNADGEQCLNCFFDRQGKCLGTPCDTGYFARISTPVNITNPIKENHNG
jgi:hypothetical protein